MADTRYYDRQGRPLAERYDALDPDRLNRGWSSLLDARSPGLACDIGAGSGRDARWLARRGWEVIAVEPSEAMRRHGEAASAGLAVTWLDDSLPALKRLRDIGYRFDLILLSAVWQHLDEDEQQRAFRILAELLRPAGHLVITLRHGRDPDENAARGFHPVSAEQLLSFARERALVEVYRGTEPDLERDDLDWETLVFALPDDGSGNLALLRHIIVNDNKSSSYKLALLRVLSRIAESMPGAVFRRDDSSISVPLGLVALLWIKQYRPLIFQHRIPVGAGEGIGFAKEAFQSLANWSDYDLHIGSTLSAENAAILVAALRDACATIVNMPTRYTTWPGRDLQVFSATRQRVRKPVSSLRVDMEFLQSFGEFRVPTGVWLSLGEFASWIEPAIIREWSTLPSKWRVAEYRSFSPDMFVWEEHQRFTGTARDRMHAIHSGGGRVCCVWSARSRSLEIDHCFPWSRWPNNDLWNLVPAEAAINRSKSDRLPSVTMFADARQRIQRWWTQAYVDTPLSQRFDDEIRLALPNLPADDAPPDLDAVFNAMLHQRARLKANQQLADWELTRR